ncbi:uncharacterized protein LOC127080334 [Lathyrus oleraceus]|uniref:uncharacterized protein LOC127080334 n=1 Tax=Pisum sativum TaxID=3888 RepID=UPI0021CE06DF|nr:uncharacterized protein LOC127080334 [Pisum sativum]
MEGIPEISLSTPVDQLEVLCETIVDFYNLKRNGLDLSGDVATQGCEVYFNELNGPIYLALVWQKVLSNVQKGGNMNEVAATIFQKGSDSGVKNLKYESRILANIILGCIHHHPANNYVGYINVDHKYMLYYLAKGIKMILSSILFKYLREMVKEIRNDGSKQRKWIPLGRLILDILVERNLVAKLEEMNFRDDLYTYVGKSFNGRNLKSMLMIKDIVNLDRMDKEFVSSKRVEVYDFPLFTKQDLPEVL